VSIKVPVNIYLNNFVLYSIHTRCHRNKNYYYYKAVGLNLARKQGDTGQQKILRKKARKE
jgi:hypothetical protein